MFLAGTEVEGGSHYVGSTLRGEASSPAAYWCCWGVGSAAPPRSALPLLADARDRVAVGKPSVEP